MYKVTAYVQLWYRVFVGLSPNTLRFRSRVQYCELTMHALSKSTPCVGIPPTHGHRIVGCLFEVTEWRLLLWWWWLFVYGDSVIVWFVDSGLEIRERVRQRDDWCRVDGTEARRYMINNIDAIFFSVQTGKSVQGDPSGWLLGFVGIIFKVAF